MTEKNYDKLLEEYKHTRELLSLVLEVNDNNMFYLEQCYYSGCKAAECSRADDYKPVYLNCTKIRHCVCGFSICNNHNILGFDIVTDEECKLCEDCSKSWEGK